MNQGREEALVQQFCEAWVKDDPAFLASFFADDAVYHEVPSRRYAGLEEVRAHLDDVFEMAKVDIEVLEMASNGPVVFTERVDYITLKATGKRIDLAVAGVAVVIGGKLERWSDYYDLTPLTDPMSS